MAPHRASLKPVKKESVGAVMQALSIPRLGEGHERSGVSERVGDAGDARARTAAIVAIALTGALKRNHIMNVRISHLFAVAALALPLSHAVAGDNTLRSRDFAVAPVGQGGAVVTASEAARVVHSREIAAPSGYRANGDIQPQDVTFTKVVRSPSEFGFGQAGPDVTAVAAKAARIASRPGSAEGGVSN